MPAVASAPAFALRGHHAAFAGHQFGAEAAHRFVGRFLFQVNLLRFRDHCGANFVEIRSLRGESGEFRLHAINRPKRSEAAVGRVFAKTEQISSNSGRSSSTVFALG